VLFSPGLSTIDVVERFVLGVDAAWTDREPSGVVLLKCDDLSNNYILRAGRSYEEFSSPGMPCWDKPVTGSFPDFPRILETCINLGCAVDVIALDIPLSPDKIVGRRKADNEISRRYGGRGASTHSPTPDRPGALAPSIFSQLTDCEFHWTGGQLSDRPTFIEVYPHVAILEFFGYSYRFPYKVQKRSRYWPYLSAAKRRENIVKNLLELRHRLGDKIGNVIDFLPDIDKECPGKTLKSYEDLIDALICALVGHSFLKGGALPFGDETGVIWVPKRRGPDE
jgi:predicted RNase H-like nuclease